MKPTRSLLTSTLLLPSHLFHPLLLALPAEFRDPLALCHSERRPGPLGSTATAAKPVLSLSKGNLGWGRRSISWSTSSCTWLTSLLALPAEVGDPLARCDLRYPRAAARAGLPALPVHPQVVAIVVVREPLRLHELAHDGRSPLHHRPHRPEECAQRLVRQLRPPAIGVEARLPQHLVGVGVADARHALLGREDGLDLAAVLQQPLYEQLLAERGAHRVRAHLGPARHDRGQVAFVARKVDLAHEALVEVAQLQAVVQRKHERRAGAALLRRVAVLKAPGQHGVHHHQAAALEREEQVLALPARLRERLAGERRRELLAGRPDDDRYRHQRVRHADAGVRRVEVGAVAFEVRYLRQGPLRYGAR